MASLSRKARRFATQRHRGQLRKGDGRPFITHPTAVAGILRRHGMPEEVVSAGFLHDVLEDTPTRFEELKHHFGPRVAAMVQEVTEPDKSHSWEHRKRAYLAHLRCASRGALAISCADKLHNTVALLDAYRREGPAVFDRFSRGAEEKLAYHRQVCGQIRRSWPGCPMLGDLERAVERLQETVRGYNDSFPKEVEAKFTVKSPAPLSALGRLTRLGEFRLSGTGRECQRNTYWDTPNFRIYRRRAALKVRRAGARCELTFKRELSYRKGVSERLEVTVPVKPARLNSILAGEKMVEPILRARKMVGRGPLKEVLTLLTDRRKMLFRAGRERIELDLDRVTVLKPRRGPAGRNAGREKVCGRFVELEVENLSASPERYAEALMELRRHFGKKLVSSRQPKYKIGLRLAGLRK